ncbi:MAG: hypothetical protein GY946_29475 [bacterium]|nr:hypothetical protein [bacterium]
MSNHEVSQDARIAVELGRSEYPAAGIAHFAAACRRWRWTDRWDAFVSEATSCGVLDFLHSDPIISHSHRRPRGYPGDAKLLDLLYNFEGITTQMWESLEPGARAVSEFTYGSSEPAAVRWRKDWIAGQLAEATTMGWSVLSVAAGHMRELASLPLAPSASIVALDQDPLSLAEVSERFGFVETLRANILSVVAGRTKLPGSGLVYSAGLLDYLDDRLTSKLMSAMWAATTNRLVVANFAPYPPNLGGMELAMRWSLTYRTEHDLLRLWQGATEQGDSDVTLFRDPLGCVVYLVANRTRR